jgi:hypothetical protein
MCKCGASYTTSCVKCNINPPNFQSGIAGVGITNITINNFGELVITLTNGTVINAGTVEGTNGLGIQSITYNNQNELEITYTDNTVQTFTLKDKTFFIAAAESSVVDVLGNSLVAPAVIEGDTRFNKDTGSFQIFDGTNWVKHLSVGNRLVSNLKELDGGQTLPTFFQTGAGIQNTELFSKTISYNDILSKLEVGEAIRINLSGRIHGELLRAAGIYIGTLDANYPLFHISLNQGVTSITTNPVGDGKSATSYRLIFRNLDASFSLGHFLPFKSTITITKYNASPMHFIVDSELLQWQEDSGYAWRQSHVQNSYEIFLPKVQSQRTVDNIGGGITSDIVYSFKYICNNSGMVVTNPGNHGIRIDNFFIEKIQK